ncbi:rRNA processing [Abeliophyllum distichum]|uniref:rRNA processing n=1 Tax=Abeliophyllum distichum TaxID=126358 RepID=A0ABD1TCY0_9LAMI
MALGWIKNKKKMMKKNMQRLGGAGLSLEAFANAKTRNNNYNPAIIKKQREFYKNAKYLRKYKKSLKQQEQHNDPSTTARPSEMENETEEDRNVEQKNKKSKNARSLKELYEKKHEEQEKARLEREAMIQAMKEKREKSDTQRKALKEKMFKKTRSGQPVMKYRIEHMLETIEKLNKASST